MGLNELAADIHFTSTSKGFEPPNAENMNQKLLLAVSEICEAQEELRDGRALTEIYYEDSPALPSPSDMIYGQQFNKKPCGFPVEIADTIIRLLHIMSSIGVDIDAVVAEKIAYNKTRPDKHGRRF